MLSLSLAISDLLALTGTTQAAVVSATTLSQSWVSQLASGTIENASWQKVVELCRALDITPNDLLHYQLDRSLPLRIAVKREASR